jgi:hypothetical protein
MVAQVELLIEGTVAQPYYGIPLPIVNGNLTAKRTGIENEDSTFSCPTNEGSGFMLWHYAEAELRKRPHSLRVGSSRRLTTLEKMRLSRHRPCH